MRTTICQHCKSEIVAPIGRKFCNANCQSMFLYEQRRPKLFLQQPNGTEAVRYMDLSQCCVFQPRECARCRKPFWAYGRKTDLNRLKYCSKSCNERAKRERAGGWCMDNTLKQCAICGAGFTPTSSASKYCTTCKAKSPKAIKRSVVRAARRKAQSRACKRCGKIFELTRALKTFCSGECHYQFNYYELRRPKLVQPPIEKRCLQCGEVFTARLGHNGTQKFCSKECNGAEKRQRYPERIRVAANKYAIKARDQITDAYAVSLIGRGDLLKKDIPIELIELKRAQLLLKRTLKQKQQTNI